MEQTEPGQPGFPPLTVLQFRTVRFYLCSSSGVMSLIKHSLSTPGKAVFIGKSLLPWPVGPELGSSAGCRGDGQPFHWPGSLLYLDVVVWEECGYTGGKTYTRSVFVEVASATQACGPQPPSPLSLDRMYLESRSRASTAAGPVPRPWRASAMLHCASPVHIDPQTLTCSCWYSCLFPALVPSDFF